MRMMKVALVAAILASLAVLGSTALAATHSGRVQVFVPNPEGTKAKILFTGVIGDYGTTVEVNKQGKVDPNGNFQKVTLTNGGFWVDTPALTKKYGTLKPTINPSTCSLLFSVSAPTKVSRGTGAYKAIKGTVTITSTFAGIAPRFKTGAKKGQCNFSNNANPLSQYDTITGVGRVSY
jgi:hypothetical protein